MTTLSDTQHLPSEKKWLTSFLTAFPAWFAAIGAVIYATGFLIITTFLGAMGVNDIGSEAVKAKYFHVGILCVLTPASLIIISIAYFRMRAAIEDLQAENQGAGTLMTIGAVLPTYLIMINLVVAFYLLVLFARRGYYQNHMMVVLAIFVVSLGGAILVRSMEDLLDTLIRRHPEMKGLGNYLGASFWNQVRWICFWLGLLLSIFIVRDLWDILLEMFLQGGYLYFGFSLLLAVILFRVSRRIRHKDFQPIVNQLIAMTVALSAVIYYLSVLAFAHRVYPFIPVSKGGGDFTGEAPVIFHFDGTNANFIPRRLLDKTDTNGVTTIPLLIIEQNSATIYVSETNSAGGPVEWRLAKTDAKPSLIGIKREAVLVRETLDRPNFAMPQAVTRPAKK